MDIIFYHGHCPDGWCAAYIASKRYPNAKLVPLDHGAPFDFTQVDGKDVLMLDFSLRTREDNDRIAARAKSFRVLDHHKTAQTVLEGAPYAVFDMKRSGAGLAWDYLFGKDSDTGAIFGYEINTAPYRPSENPHVVAEGIAAYEKQEKERTKSIRGMRSIGMMRPINRPWWVSYTECRDLWTWDLPWAKEVCAYLGTLEFTREAWDSLYELEAKDAAYQGEGALAHINHYVREAVKQAQTGVLQGYKTAVLNVPYLNCSEVGNELAKTHDVSLTYFERGDSMIQFSLRSIGDIDVSVIAKVLGGGGHKNAAGFQLPLIKGREIVDKILGRQNV